jgi:hypothetical protein
MNMKNGGEKVFIGHFELRLGIDALFFSEENIPLHPDMVCSRKFPLVNMPFICFEAVKLFIPNVKSLPHGTKFRVIGRKTKAKGFRAFTVKSNLRKRELDVKYTKAIACGNGDILNTFEFFYTAGQDACAYIFGKGITDFTEETKIFVKVEIKG